METIGLGTATALMFDHEKLNIIGWSGNSPGSSIFYRQVADQLECGVPSRTRTPTSMRKKMKQPIAKIWSRLFAIDHCHVCSFGNLTAEQD
jgi:hypothetical protein